MKLKNINKLEKIIKKMEGLKQNTGIEYQKNLSIEKQLTQLDKTLEKLEKQCDSNFAELEKIKIKTTSNNHKKGLHYFGICKYQEATGCFLEHYKKKTTKIEKQRYKELINILFKSTKYYTKSQKEALEIFKEKTKKKKIYNTLLRCFEPFL